MSDDFFKKKSQLTILEERLNDKIIDLEKKLEELTFNYERDSKRISREIEIAKESLERHLVKKNIN